MGIFCNFNKLLYYRSVSVPASVSVLLNNVAAAWPRILAHALNWHKKEIKIL